MQTMGIRPPLAHGLERAYLLLAGNRLAELTFEDLSLSERDLVLGALRAQLSRAHHHAQRAFAARIASRLCAGGVMVAVFGVGTRLHFSPAGKLWLADLGVEFVAWGLAMVIAVGALGAGEWFARREKKVEGHWNRRSADLEFAILRGHSAPSPANA